tara:strand:- start:13671 stop:14267 length:597 start_codon:yes stop_codon:yes gene_type:complete
MKDITNLFGNYRILLASQSPRRKELLEGMQINFELKKIEVEESYPSSILVEEIPEYLSQKKAQTAIVGIKENELVICADTIVICDDKVLEKPLNIAEAISMLETLSGNKHEVISGVCIANSSRQHSFSVKTQVFMKKLSISEITHYVENFKPYDKAGAYGIQEWIGLIGVEKIEGSFYNVMGLPTKEFYEALIEFCKK